MKSEAKPFTEAWIFLFITVGLNLIVFWGPLAVFQVPAASLEEGSRGPGWALALFMLGGFSPSITAIVMTAVLEGGAGLKALFRRIDPRTMSLKWHGIVLLVVVIGIGAQLLILRIIEADFDISLFGKRISFLLPLLILGPLSEELGWRGFALGRLQRRLNALNSSLVVGALWAVWHLPLFYIPGASQNIYDMSFLAFSVGVVAISVLYTWVFNNTGGSIWSAVFFHWMYTWALDVMSSGLRPPPRLYLLLSNTPYILIAIFVIAAWGPKTLTGKANH
jgi:hypothetical protein